MVFLNLKQILKIYVWMIYLILLVLNNILSLQELITKWDKQKLQNSEIFYLVPEPTTLVGNMAWIRIYLNQVLWYHITGPNNFLSRDYKLISAPHLFLTQKSPYNLKCHH